MKAPSSEKNYTCAELLSATLFELFPNTIPLGVHAWPWGFFVDCVLEAPLEETLLPSLITHTKRMLKGGAHCEKLTMMRKNAMAFFREKRLFSLVRRLEVLQEDVVELCKIGDYYDIASFQEDRTIQEIILHNIEVRHASYPPFGMVRLTRIYGAVFDSKEQKKHYLKHIYKNVSAKALAEKMQLLFYKESDCYITPQGTDLWNLLRQKVAEMLTSLGYKEVIAPKNRAFMLPSFPKIYEWVWCEENVSFPLQEPLYNDPSVLSCQFHALCMQEELAQELTSLLKIFSEMARMLRLDCSVSLVAPQSGERKHLRTAKDALLSALHACSMRYEESRKSALVGPQVHLQVLDFRGRPQTIVTICVDCVAMEQKPLKELAGKPYCITGSAPTSFGRVLALLLERDSAMLLHK